MRCREIRQGSYLWLVIFICLITNIMSVEAQVVQSKDLVAFAQIENPAGSNITQSIPQAGLLPFPLRLEGQVLRRDPQLTGGKLGATGNIALRFIRLEKTRPDRPEFRQLSIYDTAVANNSIEVMWVATAQGHQVVVKKAPAEMSFENSGGYSWLGTAEVVLIDGAPVDQPDRYEVKFTPDRLNRKVNPRDVLPPAISGVLFRGEIASGNGNLLVNDKAEIEITSARMLLSKYLRVGLNPKFDVGRRNVTVSAIINDRRVQVTRFMRSSVTSDDFDIDLEQEQVPRFTDNIQFTLVVTLHRADRTDATDRHRVAVLLPVVVVPGIASTRGNDRGGDKEFPALNNYLRQKSDELISPNVADHPKYLGEGYRLQTDYHQGYWTLSTLEYDRNRTPLDVGANHLSNHIEEICKQTYADKVFLLGHSYGGLISRMYIQVGRGKERVKEFIQAQSPNVGALWAVWGQTAGRLANYYYYHLYPLYDAENQLHQIFNRVTVTPFQAIAPENKELQRLNGLAADNSYSPFPKIIPYTMLVSNSERTQWGVTYMWGTGLKPNTFLLRYCDGDGIVPIFSQLGVLPNTNSVPEEALPQLLNRTTITKKDRVPALQEATITVKWFTGTHAGDWDIFGDVILFLRTNASEYEPPAPTSADYQFIQQPAVMCFLWTQRFGTGIGNIENCPH